MRELAHCRPTTAFGASRSQANVIMKDLTPSFAKFRLSRYSKGCGYVNRSDTVFAIRCLDAREPVLFETPRETRIARKRVR